LKKSYEKALSTFDGLNRKFDDIKTTLQAKQINVDDLTSRCHEMTTTAVHLMEVVKDVAPEKVPTNFGDITASRTLEKMRKQLDTLTKEQNEQSVIRTAEGQELMNSQWQLGQIQLMYSDLQDRLRQFENGEAVTADIRKFPNLPSYNSGNSSNAIVPRHTPARSSKKSKSSRSSLVSGRKSLGRKDQEQEPISEKVQALFADISANLEVGDGPIDIRVDITHEEEFSCSESCTPNKENIVIVESHNIIMEQAPVRTLKDIAGLDVNMLRRPMLSNSTTPPRASGRSSAHQHIQRSNTSSNSNSVMRGSTRQQEKQKRALMRNYGGGMPGEAPEANRVLVPRASPNTIQQASVPPQVPQQQNTEGKECPQQ